MKRNPSPHDSSLIEQQAERLKDYQFETRLEEQGHVVSVGDGIAWVKGLPDAAMEEFISFSDGSRGVVFHLAKKMIGVVLLGQTSRLTAGTTAHLGGQALSIGVGDGLLGRVVNPLGIPLDDGAPISVTCRQLLEKRSPTIINRDFVREPLYTGIKTIDAMIPIGKGQRQLIVGDKGLGRSAIALDTVINQKGKNVRCIYVSVGQKRSSVVSTIDTLKHYGAMDYTTVVVGEATALPGLQYIAPFAGCAIAEAWMGQGEDTLVIYDDLSTHARAYRELSLLLRRPPGREAYPGDIFFLHARLLERATCLSPEAGGGSMTALPIVETQQGEIASYIPTNLISITDGQIYLDAALFASGFRPAIDVGRSVSRIGGKAQHRRIKEEAGRMKLDYLQFLELEIFTRFGARLEASMEAKLTRGHVLRELLKQGRFQAREIECLMAWLVAFNEGVFDQIEVNHIASHLDKLAHHVGQSDLSLDSSREQWVAAVSRWLSHE